MRRATEHLHETVATLDDTAAHEPSRLGGWSRSHVVSHLARNADGLVNLLTWARTGIEHPMYASNADRDADVEEGAHRLMQVLREDLRAAGDRFEFAAQQLTSADWQATVTNRQGRQVQVSMVPWMRLIEVLVHLSDLNVGIGLDRSMDLAGDEVATIVDYVVWTYATRPDVPALRLYVRLPSGEEQCWSIGDGEPTVVRGDAVATLAWLTGRSGEPDLLADRPLPTLPAWL